MAQIVVTMLDHMGSDLTTVNSARVSFNKNSEAKSWSHYDYGNNSGDFIANLEDRDIRLINYLAKHKHLSPFGHCFASFRVKAPIFVARQLVKHQYLRWNEISRRYVDSEPEFYVPNVWRGKAEDKKQGSGGKITTSCVYDTYGELTHPSFAAMDAQDAALHIYNNMIKAGVCPEQARMVLPQSLMTEWVWSGSLDAFASMCNLRCKEDTQYESRVVADQIDERMRELFPLSWKALRGETDEIL